MVENVWQIFLWFKSIITGDNLIGPIKKLGTINPVTLVKLFIYLELHIVINLEVF